MAARESIETPGRSGRCGVGLRARVLAAALCLTAGGCKQEPRDKGTAPPSTRGLVPPAVLFHGCARVRQGPICEIRGAGTPEQRRLKLWVPGPVLDQRNRRLADFALATNLGPLARLSPQAVDGGHLIEVEVPTGARWLQIQREEAGADVSTPFVLELAIHQPNEAVARARAALRTGDAAAARAVLEQALRDPKSGVGDRSRVQAALARIELGQGQLNQAESLLKRARQAALAAGWISDAFEDGDIIFYIQLGRRRDLAAAARTLEAQEPVVAYPFARARQHHSRALLAMDMGDFSAALAEFHAASRLSRRIGDTGYDSFSSAERGRALVRVGRFAEAALLLESALDTSPDADACDRRIMANNLFWARAAPLRQAARSGLAGDLGAARTALDALTAKWQKSSGDCDDLERSVEHAVDVIGAALDLGDDARAHRAFAALPSIKSIANPALQVWITGLRGQLALRAGENRQAIADFQRQRALAQAVDMPAESIEAVLNLGRAFETQGGWAAAAEHYEEAESLLDQYVGGVALGLGRGSLNQLFSTGAARLTATLVQLNRPKDALAALRRARLRLVRAVAGQRSAAHLTAAARAQYLAAVTAYHQARERIETAAASDWKMSAEALQRAHADRRVLLEEGRQALDRAFILAGHSSVETEKIARLPQPGELWLAFLPMVDRRGEWLGFALSPTTMRARRIETSRAGKDVAASLLAAFAREIESADTIRILDDTALSGLDLHAAPFASARGAAPLAAVRQVAYLLDLPSGPEPTAPRPAVLSILLAGNPAGDLPESERELDAVKHLLASAVPAFGPVHMLRGPAVRLDALISTLPRVWAFHFAGHAGLGGPDGIDDALELAAGARLSLQDILALPAVPTLVVLSACHAAAAVAGSGTDAATETRTAGAGPSGLGLAQAFLVRGGRFALAPSRAVSDATAAAFSRAFYQALIVREPELRAPKGASAVRSQGRQPVPGAAGVLAAYRHAVATTAAADLADWQSFRLLTP